MAKRAKLCLFRDTAIRSKLVAGVLCCLAGSTVLPIQAGLAPYSVTTDLRYDMAKETLDDELSLSRLTLQPQAKWRFGKRWRGEVSLRMEWADDRTGLGTLDNFSSYSQPLIKGQRARVELDKAKLSWRDGKRRITLGKQVAAWGVLDGIRITDRFDPVRRRDFIFTDTRPERIARWGVQTQTEVSGWRVQTALALDPTVSQQANLEDTFALQSTRFTQGLSLQGTNALIETQPRNQGFKEATLGVRFGRTFGSNQLSLLAFNGPTTDPILQLDQIGNRPRVTLRYPKRSLVGLSWDRTLGSTVIRGEAAYIPDQSINVVTASGLEHTRRKRWLAGLGLDWNAPLNLFVNAQVGLDHITNGPEKLNRPNTDLIATLRIQRHFHQAGWKLQCEWIGSLNQGDRVIRPIVEKELNDSVSLSLGADLAYGNANGLFGQFHDQSRGWARLQVRW